MLSIKPLDIVQDWISVKDRLPALDTITGNNYSIDCHITDGVNCITGYYDFDTEEWVYNSHYEMNPTHFIEVVLPPLPKIK